MTFSRRIAWIALLAVLAACGVPHTTSDFAIEKVAIDEESLSRVIDRYDAVRQTALHLLNPQPLASIQRGPLLQIDAGRIEVARSLQAEAVDERDESGRLVIEQFYAPIVDSYPMWFMAVVRDTREEHVKVQVYQRSAAADSWVLVASPEILTTTSLPLMRAGRDDSLIQLDPDDRSGLVDAPRVVAQQYVEALDDPESDAVLQITQDGFWTQMRDARDAASRIDGIEYDAVWELLDADYAARTDDGGALVFATLQRTDAYASEEGLAIAWPPGSPEEAFLSDRLSGEGTLTYLYQVLLYVPPAGGEAPFVMGHYGGVVSADSL